MPGQIDLGLGVGIWYVLGYLVTTFVTPDWVTLLNRVFNPHPFCVTLKPCCATVDLQTLRHPYEAGIPEGDLQLS